MDQVTHEEIISVLAMFSRPDLIQEFKEHVKVDEDYEPPTFKMKREKYEINEGSATSESDYEIDIDEDGFQSLK